MSTFLNHRNKKNCTKATILKVHEFRKPNQAATKKPQQLSPQKPQPWNIFCVAHKTLMTTKTLIFRFIQQKQDLYLDWRDLRAFEELFGFAVMTSRKLCLKAVGSWWALIC